MRPTLLRSALALLLALALALAPAPAPAAPYWSTDFESGVPAEFSAPGAHLDAVQGWAGLGAPGNQFGGSFLRYSDLALYDTRLVLRGLPAHDHVSVGFLLALIDSWDGTELFRVHVDGTLRFEHWFQLASGDTSDYPPPPGALLSMGRELGYSLGAWYARDRAYDLGADPAFQNIPHTADSLVVTWSLGAVSGGAAQQWQAGSDESWAIDNVRVFLGATTAAGGPAAPAELALAPARANPARDGRLAVRFTLPAAGPARLEAFDAAGRRVAGRDVGALGAGAHVLDLDVGAAAAPGLYWVRLARGAEVRTTRLVLAR